MVQKIATRLPTIGDVIRAWRKFRGLRSIELAEKAEVRSQYLSEIENNKTANPREEFLEKLAEALGVPLQDILGRRLPPEDGEVGVTSDSQQAGEGYQKGVSQRTVLHAPVAIKRQKILMHRLGIAEKKLEEAGRILNELYQELREIGTLVADMQSEE
jgi:transcriptional regulator with XRE-family HTH domain